tara:strand:- start:136 stop:537 length:402 start_codon:yes stop_codon:yes gene_type:complete
MTLQQIRDVPADFDGSLPEYIVFQTLVRLGFEPGIDFNFQSPLFGGRLEKGGVVIDFLFFNPPDLAINVQGSFYHQEQGVVAVQRDRIARAQLAGQGINLIFIDEDDIKADPEAFVRDALRYIDRSFLGGIGA